MAQYATTTDLEQAGLPARALTSVTDAIKNQHLTQASLMIDSYLRGRYSTPLAQPYPDEIIRATLDLASYSILRWRGYRPGEHDEQVRLAYEDTMDWLQKLGRGECHLAIGADGTDAQEGRPRSTARVYRRTASSWTTSGDRGW